MYFITVWRRWDFEGSEVKRDVNTARCEGKFLLGIRVIPNQNGQPWEIVGS